MIDIDTVAQKRFPSGWVFVIAVLMVAFISPGGVRLVDAGGPEPTPTETINGTVTDMFSILRQFQGPDHFQARRSEIERVIRRDVHYVEMAKRSLGVSWAQIDEQARMEYVGLFVHLLRDALANRMIQYQDEKIIYLSTRRESTCAEVKTRLVGSKVDTALDFRLINEDGRWLVYDAVMDGTSLVGTYRAQFASIVRDESLTGLMNRLKANTLLVKLFDAHGS